MRRGTATLFIRAALLVMEVQVVLIVMLPETMTISVAAVIVARSATRIVVVESL